MAYRVASGNFIFGGEVQGGIGKTWDCAPPIGTVRRLSSKSALGRMGAFGGLITFEGSVTLPFEGSFCSIVAGMPNPIQTSMTVTCNTNLGGFGGFVTNTVTTGHAFDPAGTTVEIDFDGEYMFSLDGDLMVEDVADPSVDSKGFPTYGGYTIRDAPTGITKRFFIRARVGGNFVVSATVGGASAVATTVITAGNTFDVYIPKVSLSTEVESTDTANSCLIGALWQNVPLLVGGADFAFTNDGCAISAAHGIVATTSGTGRKTATCGLDGAVIRNYMLNVVARALEYPYPQNLTLKIQDTLGHIDTHVFLGEISEGITQKQWSAAGACNGVASGASLDEFTDVKCWLEPSRLTELGELPEMWRVLQRGRAFKALTLSPVATYIHTLTTASATGPADLVKSFSNPKYLQSYRFMRVRVKASSSPSPFKLKLGSKEWDKDRSGAGLSAGTSYSWFELDLCSPSSETAASDTTDTIWPTPTVDGPYWGVTSISELTLTGLSSGVTYDLAADGVELFRAEPTSDSMCTRGDWCPAWPGWILSHEAEITESVTTTVYYRRFGLCSTNGRQSLELTDFIKAVTTSGAGTTETYTNRTLEAVKTDAEAVLGGGEPVWPGWSCGIWPDADIADGTSTDWLYGYLNKNRPMTWLHGGGVMFKDNNWSYGHHVGLDEGPQLWAQELFDGIEAIGWTGDVFKHLDPSLSTGIIDLRAAVILRGGGHGIVLGENDQPAADKTVTVREVGGGGATFGTGTSDDQGRWRSGLNYAPGLESAEAQAEGGTAAAILLEPRKRTRAALTVSAVNAYKCVEIDSPRAWLHVGDGKRIRTYHVNAAAAAFASEEYAVDEWRRLRHDPRKGNLLMLGKSGSAFKLFLSNDGGLTGSEVVSVTALSAVVEVESERGLQVLLYENGGAVQRRESTDSGVTWSAAAAVSYGGGSLTGTLRDLTRDPRSGIMVLAVETGGTTAILASYDAGASWALLVS